jgi:copper chaperone CopZ
MLGAGKLVLSTPIFLLQPGVNSMRMSRAIVSGLTAFGLCAAANLYSAEPTKGTFLVTGLHCPPCTSTVQGSLSRVKGVKSVTVDWNTKNAKVVFDESELSAQALASAIETTPHMMGRGMRYGGWLALRVPSIVDAASGQKAKEILAKVEGVKTVAVYPAQHSLGVQFAGNGSLSSQQLIDALAKEGIEASN